VRTEFSWAQWLTSVILAIQEAEISRITVWGHFGLKVSKIPSQQQKVWVWWCAPVIPATWKAWVLKNNQSIEHGGSSL
jgi:hypothetical protein